MKTEENVVSFLPGDGHARTSCGRKADNRLHLALLLLVLATGHMAVMAHEYQSGEIAIDHPYAPPTPPGVVLGAGYMTVTNKGSEDDRLVGGSVDFAQRLEIHETSVDGDVSRMRELSDGLLIPAGESVTLEPMGKHMMFIELSQPLVEGTQQSGVLNFEQAGAVEVEFAVEFVTGGMEHDDMNHEDMSHGMTQEHGMGAGAQKSEGASSSDTGNTEHINPMKTQWRRPGSSGRRIPMPASVRGADMANDFVDTVETGGCLLGRIGVDAWFDKAEQCGDTVFDTDWDVTFADCGLNVSADGAGAEIGGGGASKGNSQSQNRGSDSVSGFHVVCFLLLSSN